MKAPRSGAAGAGAASLLFLLVSPFFTPTTTSAFTASPSLFGGAETQRHALSPSSSSSFHVSPRSPSTSSHSRNRWAPASSSALRAASGASGEGGDGDGDGFSFSDLQRELSRRRAQEAMAPDTEQEQQQQQQESLPGAEGREAFMEEQMASFLSVCARLCLHSIFHATFGLPCLSLFHATYCLHNVSMLSTSAVQGQGNTSRLCEYVLSVACHARCMRI